MAFYGFLTTVIAAALTSFYSWRLVFMTFFGKAHWAEDDHAHVAHGVGADAVDDQATHMPTRMATAISSIRMNRRSPC